MIAAISAITTMIIFRIDPVERLLIGK